MILCDYRERPSEIPDLLRKADCEVEFAQLPVGDYIIAGRILVERKSAADLDSSIKDRRLFDQMQRASEAYERVILIVEEGWGSLPLVGRVGALSRIIRTYGGKVSVVNVADKTELAVWLIRLYKQETQDPDSSRSPLDPTLRKQRLSDRDLRLRMLAHLPGVGAKAATALLEAHGSIAELTQLTVKELRKVEGIGKIRAERIHQILHGTEEEEADDDLI